MPKIDDLLCRYDSWLADREELSKREDDPHAAVSPSEWEASDDEGIAILYELAPAVRVLLGEDVKPDEILASQVPLPGMEEFLTEEEAA